MTRQLTPQQEEIVEQLAATGAFPDEDAVIGEALRLLEERQRYRAWLDAELQIGIDEADRGDVIEVTPEWWDDVRRRAREAAKANAAGRDAAAT